MGEHQHHWRIGVQNFIMGDEDRAFYGLIGWGIFELNGWGIYDLNGWGIYGLNGWGIMA